MKLVFLLFLIGIGGILVYLSSSQLIGHTKKKKKFNLTALSLASAVVIILLGFVAYGMYQSAIAPDTQCTTRHTTTGQPPVLLKTALDYFEEANYEYDTGNCHAAIHDYTKSIALNSNYPQAYNNRAYTNMRMRNYKEALPDLDKAIQLNPHYIQALMNRGDIYNYYYTIDRQRAVADYEKVISLGGTQETSVCGHLLLARHNGWNWGTFIGLFHEVFSPCH